MTQPDAAADDAEPVIGVLALQGAFAEHLGVLDRLGVAAREVRTPVDLDAVTALVIPGGESTSIGKLLVRSGLAEAIRARAAGPVGRAVNGGGPKSAAVLAGAATGLGGREATVTPLGRASARGTPPLAVWGTCAGLILLARDLGGSGSTVGPPQPLLGLMDLRVRRNAFGTQLDSFETTLSAPAVAPHAIPAVFIRAPVIEGVGSGVEVLARLTDGRPVAARQGRLLATAFHPELTPDPSFHRYFVEVVAA
jgi:5'-phosphate synthase pdxT subunit